MGRRVPFMYWLVDCRKDDPPACRRPTSGSMPNYNEIKAVIARQFVGQFSVAARARIQACQDQSVTDTLTQVEAGFTDPAPV